MRPWCPVGTLNRELPALAVNNGAVCEVLTAVTQTSWALAPTVTYRTPARCRLMESPYLRGAAPPPACATAPPGGIIGGLKARERLA
jgi:hypothetical protein